jgi:hypothetical protein
MSKKIYLAADARVRLDELGSAPGSAGHRACSPHFARLGGRERLPLHGTGS